MKSTTKHYKKRARRLEPEASLVSWVKHGQTTWWVCWSGLPCNADSARTPELAWKAACEFLEDRLWNRALESL